jgi:dihydroceramidase
VLVAAVVTVGLGVALVTAVVTSRDALAALRPATCLPSACFCEAVRPDGLAQPVNALTSLTYVALGLWALAGGVRPSPGHEPQHGSRRLTPRLMAATGVVLVALGAGSFVYHGSLTFVGQVLDVQGMYLLGVLLLVGALVRGGVLRPAPAPWVYLAAVGVLLVVQVLWPDSRRVLFGLVLLPGVLLEGLPRTTGVPWRSRPMLPFRVGVGMLVLAYAAWLLDALKVLCWPTSPWQGHGLWHVLTALAAVLVVAHYARTPGAGRRS